MSTPSRGVVAGHPTAYKHGHGPRNSRADHHLWKGGRGYRRGYVHIYMPEHPGCDSKGYVAEHRLVCGQTLGRPLRHDEEVHHINGIKDDNRPENLVALTKSQHALAHRDRTVSNFEAAKAADPAHNSKAGKKGADARWGRKA